MRNQTSDNRQSGSGAESTRWWALSLDQVFAELGIDAEEGGLSETDVAERRREHGPNRVEQQKSRSWFAVLIDQFKSSIMAILIAATVAAFIFEGLGEGIAVGAVVVANALIGFFTELRAVRRMEALAELGRTTVTVRRDGSTREIDAEELVPGDRFLVEEGLEVPADARLLETNRTRADESTLTGESEQVAKQTDPVGDDAHLAERTNILFKGTYVTRGSGEAVVVGTGRNTELGRIRQLVSESKAAHTPLEKRLNLLGRRLVIVTIVAAVAATVSGIITGRSLILMIETGIALAVAAVPEGLPIVATIALATGLHEMAKRHALVNRLSSVETLGSTTVICTDKTGTLTENQQTVVEFALPTDDGPERFARDQFDGAAEQVRSRVHDLRELGALCTNVEGSSVVGDPLEVALVRDANQADIGLEELRERYPEVQEIAFDSSLMEMATIHRNDGDGFAVVKGAPERVLGQCDGVDAERWQEIAEQMSDEGLKVIAVARRDIDLNEDAEYAPDDVYHSLSFRGLVGLRDPARADVAEAIKRCQDAGIEVVMVTGDNARTARAIGVEVGIIANRSAPVKSGEETDAFLAANDRSQDVRIFARVTPEQKLAIIDWFQARGEIVAMTGDGVNDAPALESADIGVAMGGRGTDVAAEASDMVLTDDALGSVVSAVRYGRIIFSNIRKFVVYLMSCNLAEIIAVGVAAVAALQLPLLPLQILFLNVVTGVFPALALGVGPGAGDVMDHPPRDPQKPVLEPRHWRALVGFSVLIAAAVMGAFLLALGPLGLQTDMAVTVSFLTLGFSQVWHVFTMRDRAEGILRNDITRNRWVWGAVALCLALIIGVATVPGVSGVLSLVPLPRPGWLLAIGASLTVPLLGPVVARLVSAKQALFGA